MFYVQLIHLFLFYFLSINPTNGISSRLFINNKTSASRFPRQTTDHGKKCQIPDNPFHGEYSIGGDETREFQTGNYVPEYRVLLLKCVNGYKPAPPQQRPTLCLDGSWTPEPSYCSRTCRPLSSSKSTKIRCSFRNTHLETCNDPVEGTVAQFSCEPLYEDPSIEFSPYRLCQDGDWNGIPQCFPICGQKHPTGEASVIHGTTAKIGDYPWHVGIYTNEKEFKCGGAVISPSVILSAAHCFADLSDGTPYPKENYLIAAGKHYRNYDDSKDEFSQYPTIDGIHIPSQYRGAQLQHEADIAVIILATSLTLSEAVQPVCVDWSNLFEYQQLAPDNYGVVTGWGYTREGLDLADELKELSVPFVPFNQCFGSVPKSFQKFVRGDKMCAGYLNSATAVCHGDSGGALVFPRSSNGRFYIRGIVSTSPATNERQCDSDHYGLYTLVSKHIEFVYTHYHYHSSKRSSPLPNVVTTTPITATLATPKNPTTAEKPSTTTGSCQIPPSPSSGAYAGVGDSTQDQAGDYLPQYSVLTLTCEQDYQPKTNNSLCVNGSWVPTPSVCYRLCPLLNSTKSTRVACKYNGVRLENCDDPIEGTIAEFSCEPFYEESSLSRNPTRVCRDGFWDFPVPQCYPSCGEKRPRGTTNIINGTNVVLGDYPWHVGIYSDAVVKSYLCGGALITESVVLSAAQCVSDFEGMLLPKEDYLIAAGKYYRVYDDPRDADAQYSNVDAIHIPETYKGRDSFYEADVAVLMLTRAFVLSLSIQPVCIDLFNDFENELLTANNYGVITGWGYTKEGSELSEELKELKVPYVPFDQCFENVPRGFRRYLTSDKICSGYLNEGKSICGGDNGGALVFPRQRNDRYYVTAIGGICPATISGSCDSNQYAVYTLVSKYAEFIGQFVTIYVINCDRKYKPSPPGSSYSLCLKGIWSPAPSTCSLSINLSNGIPSTLFVKNKTNTTNRLRRQTNHEDFNYQIPDDPFLGEYSIGGDDTLIYKTGDYVPEYRVLLLNCSKGYKPSPPEQRPTLCLNGLWKPEPRICSRTCRPLSASKTMQIQCSFNNKPLETCNDPVEGTVAQFSCEALYEDISIEYNPFRLCEDGNWDGIPSCFPTAHCFADLGNGTQYPKENYLVAVGKHYRHYDDSNDEYSQYPTIDAIHIPSQYRGSKLQHESDIAVIILATSLTLSEAVQPVCVDWTNLFEHQQLVPDNYGVVTGWGFTREGLELADELKELSVPFAPFDKCFQNVPMSFQKYLRSDKICGGYINSSTSVCQGDSGGALVFPRSSNGRFYIRGIVSTSPATRQGQCDSNQYGLFTLVSKHMEFVSTYYHISRRPSKSSTNRNSVNTSSTLQLQTKISNGGVQPATPTPMPTPVTTVKPPIAPGSCKIPEFPPNATYLVGGSSSDAYKPGDYVTEFDSLILNCNKKFIPNPVGSAYSLCVNGIWNPQPTTCSQWCLPLTSTKTTKVRCKYNDVWLENCNNPIEGTVAEISCEPFYEEPSIKQNSSRVCRDGAWDYPISQCYPVCGKKRTKGHTKRKRKVISSDFPWQIGIYKADKTYLCGGVLIDEHVVLTAAHCVTNDYDGSLLSKENYLKPQYSTVDAIYVPDMFKGRSSFYQADIAVIILASAFDLSESVQPVCIDFTNEFENEPLISSNNGVLAGWSYPESKNETAKELNQTSVPSVPYKQCIDEIIPPFRRYLTYDKICAGDLHNGVTQICRGYSGGALAVPRQRRYYAIGILSVQLSPQREIGIVCDSNLYGGYTLISKHLSMLQDVMTRLRLSRNSNRDKLKLLFMLF